MTRQRAGARHEKANRDAYKNASAGSVNIRRNQARDKQRAARAIAAERRRRAVEQRPRHLRVDLRDPGRRAAAAVRLRQRGAMVQRLEDAITADARSRVRARLLPVRRISTTHCHALANGAPGDERDLAKPLGRYACEAVVAAARNKALLSTLGVPFVGTIDFTRGRLTWCKDNPVGAGDVESAYAFVRLSRECTAARASHRCTCRASTSTGTSPAHSCTPPPRSPA